MVALCLPLEGLNVKVFGHPFVAASDADRRAVDDYAAGMRQGVKDRLQTLAAGLTGSTWYQHHLWPADYWRLWSDAIIHRIHLRVLRHIKVLSEQTPV